MRPTGACAMSHDGGSLGGAGAGRTVRPFPRFQVLGAFGGQRIARFGRKEAFEEEIARTLSASGAEKQNLTGNSKYGAAPLLIPAEGS
jgi:hypothetical protein